ncbi:MAG: hypothetical protein ABR569_12720, partial [Gaiellaceae bacterium]
MQHVSGSADDVRARVPAVLAAWEFMRDNVLEAGVVDQRLKELAFRYLAQDPETLDFDRFAGRERLALEWANAIAWEA